MTSQQIAYWNLVNERAKLGEVARHNLADEGIRDATQKETARNNRAVLTETERSNRAREAETNRHNLFSERNDSFNAMTNYTNAVTRQKELDETHRSNVVREGETNRHNRESEAWTAYNIMETQRHNKETEWENTRHNTADEFEKNRHNIKSEELGFQDLNVQYSRNAELRRHNQAQEWQANKQSDIDFTLGLEKNKRAIDANAIDNAEVFLKSELGKAGIKKDYITSIINGLTKILVVGATAAMK